MIYGYHRASTKEQNTDRGIYGIEEYCEKQGLSLEKIFVDKACGNNFNRARYIVMKEDVLRNGDILILHELDRLGRNKTEILNELRYFKDHGVRVMFLDVPTSTMDVSGLPDHLSRLMLDTVNNILIEFLTMIAETEIERKKKRCDEGREAMKARGEWHRYGRPRKMLKNKFAEQYARVEKKEIGSLALMRELGLNRDTFFRYVREYKSSR